MLGRSLSQFVGCFVAYGKRHMTVRVTEVAVVKRLRQVLAAEGKYLRTASSRKQKRWGLGHYYLVGTKGVVNKDIDIQKLARDLKLLRPWESLSE